MNRAGGFSARELPGFKKGPKLKLDVRSMLIVYLLSSIVICAIGVKVTYGCLDESIDRKIISNRKSKENLALRRCINFYVPSVVPTTLSIVSSLV